MRRLSYLMPAAGVSRGVSRYMWLGGSCSLLAETCFQLFGFKSLGFSGTEEVKYRNARLSH